ncbi:MAG TPA: DUF4926 domain-containing protein [Saprospiraceae bacterium]|nr:DUF4926 domain-containing protein [Saprospiraceae bacterium]
MFTEYDVVRSLINLPKVPVGSVGTILIVHESNMDYLVEFVDIETGESLNVLTVSQKDIEKLDKNIGKVAK